MTAWLAMMAAAIESRVSASWPQPGGARAKKGFAVESGWPMT